MPLGLTEVEMMSVIDTAHEAEIRLEIHQGLPIWDFSPSPLHTNEAKRIEGSVRRNPSSSRDCSGHSFQDMSVRFPGGSLRRPDIAVFCELPAPTQEATPLIPSAVIEIVSPGSEVKDLELSSSFYLMHGVPDVLVLDPRTGVVSHFRRDGHRRLNTSVDVEIE